MSSLTSTSLHAVPVVRIADGEPFVLEVVRSMARARSWRMLLAKPFEFADLAAILTPIFSKRMTA